MTVHFSFTLPPETFQTQAQVLTYGTALIPAPPPLDLKILSNNTTGLTISYSLDFTTAPLAAAAIIKALKTEIPT